MQKRKEESGDEGKGKEEGRERRKEGREARIGKAMREKTVFQ